MQWNTLRNPNITLHCIILEDMTFLTFRQDSRKRKISKIVAIGESLIFSHTEIGISIIAVQCIYVIRIVQSK